MAAPPAPSTVLLTSYAGLRQSLFKKRFLRKTSAAALRDGAASFADLRSEFLRLGAFEYAALCAAERARCFDAAGDAQWVAVERATAGGMYWELAADMPSCALGGGFETNATRGTECLSAAIQAFLGRSQYAVSASLFHTMAFSLSATRYPSKAAQCLTKAVQLTEKLSPLTAGQALHAVVENEIERGEYECAAATAHAEEAMASTARGGVMAPAVLDTLITQCLLAVMRGDNEAVAALSTKAAAAGATQDTLDLLECLRDAHEAREVDTLLDLQSELWPLLTAAQNTVVARLVDADVYPDVFHPR